MTQISPTVSSSLPSPYLCCGKTGGTEGTGIRRGAERTARSIKEGTEIRVASSAYARTQAIRQQDIIRCGAAAARGGHLAAHGNPTYSDGLRAIGRGGSCRGHDGIVADEVVGHDRVEVSARRDTI